MTAEKLEEVRKAEEEARRLVRAVEAAVERAQEAGIRRYLPEVKAARLANGCW